MSGQNLHGAGLVSSRAQYDAADGSSPKDADPSGRRNPDPPRIQGIDCVLYDRVQSRLSARVQGYVARHYLEMA